MIQRYCTCQDTCGGKTQMWSLIALHYLLVGGSQYVNALFLNVCLFIVCEKHLRSAVTGSKLGTVVIAWDLKVSL